MIRLLSALLLALYFISADLNAGTIVLFGNPPQAKYVGQMMFDSARLQIDPVTFETIESKFILRRLGDPKNPISQVKFSAEIIGRWHQNKHNVNSMFDPTELNFQIGELERASRGTHELKTHAGFQGLKLQEVSLPGSEKVIYKASRVIGGMPRGIKAGSMAFPTISAMLARKLVKVIIPLTNIIIK